jgi:hypothetical protein
MNKELIQKLFSKSCWDEQAEVDIEDWCDVEKFAELIVQECGVALSPVLRDMVSRGQAFDLIKKHFGVEE